MVDAGLTRLAEGDVRPSGDTLLVYLPDCERPPRRRILQGMNTRRSFPVRLCISLSSRLLPLALVAGGLTACTRVETRGAAPPLPQVTAAAAITRNVTEWDEFTGRLEAVQSVSVRPRVSGLISKVSFDEGSMVRQGQVVQLSAKRT